MVFYPVASRLPIGPSIATLLLTLTSQLLSGSPAKSQSTPGLAGFPPYCQQSLEEIAQKDRDRKAAFSQDPEGIARYEQIVARHAQYIQACRNQNPIKTEGIWLRLYPCDVTPGNLDEILDRIVSRGYNQVFVETFFNGKVLLPAASNRTAWRSMVDTPGQENFDLLAEVIRKGRLRGLKVVSWMFALNVGVDYINSPGKAGIIARNGRGENTIEVNRATRDLNNTFNPDEAFADPYHPTLRQDYLFMVQELLKYRPDGMVFDYIRYPKGRGPKSIADDLGDLWIFGEAAQLGLIQRGTNSKGRELITRYLREQRITDQDVAEVDRLYPQEAEPQWHARITLPGENQLSLLERTRHLQSELWRLALGHAMQGVVDFVTLVSEPVQRSGLPAGAVFFPDGNQTAGRGYDSRLQMWDRFPESIERYPMSYGTCGQADCIVNQVQRVFNMTRNSAIIKPVLAGIWQQPHTGRPPLDVQMQALQRSFPGLSSISHFAYSWQEPESDRDRKFCRVRPSPIRPLPVRPSP